MISPTTTGFHFLPSPSGGGFSTLVITIPTGTTASVSVVGATDPDDTDTIYAINLSGTQVTFDASGDYRSIAVDVSGWKIIGLDIASISGGPVHASLIGTG